MSDFALHKKKNTVCLYFWLQSKPQVKGQQWILQVINSHNHLQAKIVKINNNIALWPVVFSYLTLDSLHKRLWVLSEWLLTPTSRW